MIRYPTTKHSVRYSKVKFVLQREAGIYIRGTANNGPVCGSPGFIVLGEIVFLRSVIAENFDVAREFTAEIL